MVELWEDGTRWNGGGGEGVRMEATAMASVAGARRSGSAMYALGGSLGRDDRNRIASDGSTQHGRACGQAGGMQRMRSGPLGVKGKETWAGGICAGAFSLKGPKAG